MAVSDETYADEKLFSAQARFLRYIGEHPGISQAELARATDMAATLTGRLLQTLLERGFVERAPSREDRREYVLTLSPAGERMRRRVVDARGRFAARVVSVLDERDLDDFDRISYKLFAAFGAAPSPGAATRGAEPRPGRPSGSQPRRKARK
ncbi:MarR family winged helix-turn-helix transcriptional regulator [Sorangium sp. So ce131]|uniref:MarR family winged helix-turn-helix transcriptional regulator n=1 Tax=Sorangium sp. So ce131 TaxID=3133282 RepID=UPI003F5F5E2B